MTEDNKLGLTGDSLETAKKVGGVTRLSFIEALYGCPIYSRKLGQVIQQIPGERIYNDLLGSALPPLEIDRIFSYIGFIQGTQPRSYRSLARDEGLPVTRLRRNLGASLRVVMNLRLNGLLPSCGVELNQNCPLNT